MVIATALGLADLPSIALSVGLAFVFGYALTLRPLVAAGLSFRQAVHVALAADTVSVTVMEIADNAFLLAVPGALAAGLSDGLFWGEPRCIPCGRFRRHRADQPGDDPARAGPCRGARPPRSLSVESRAKPHDS